jgi:transcriptional regulator with XRE-family HTH domain
MEIGRRIRALREARNLSQGDIEERTGLLRCYTSRVENGYTVPTIGTLEAYAKALEIPLYRFFCDGKEPPKRPAQPSAEGAQLLWGSSGNERHKLRKFAKLLSRMDQRNRAILLRTAQHMARRKLRPTE